MWIIEVVRNLKQGEALWTVEETLDKLISLQGQTVNLSSILQKHEPNHVHYRANWHPDQPQEPAPLRSALLSIPNHRVKSRQIQHLYENYFRELGMESHVTAMFYDNPDYEILVEPDSQGDKVKSWPTKKTLAFFPWVDFSINFSLSSAIKEQARRKLDGFDLAITLNTTKTEGGLYQIDIPTNEDELRDEDTWRQYLQKDIIFHSRARGLPDGEWDTNSFVIERGSQRLLTDLLAARV